MSEWTIVTVIATLVGLLVTVVRPLMDLNATITRLTEVVNTLEKNISGLSAKNSESHGRIWEKVGEHDEMLNRHETRLLILEHDDEKEKSGLNGCPGV
jgi:hypothetical protein